MVARGLNMPCRLREHGMFGPTSEKRHGVTALEDLARLVVLASCSSPSLVLSGRVKQHRATEH
ncbi:hypothetical protein NC652_010700 [Populus alba x Populus x berolinensis]|nr:hypothetical protein NC652_010700 [Populus alba x Populus x berolinensis]